MDSSVRMKTFAHIVAKVFVVLGKTVAAVVLAVVAVGSAGYVCVPVYDFSAPRAFSGEAVFNPYEGADFGSARRAIFHFHTDRSDGKNSLHEVVNAYQSAGYDIVTPADHDRITIPEHDVEEGALRVYEHGLNAYRFHDLVFGAEEPMRFQLPLWQGVSGREYMLRRLSERFPMVVLNHPGTVRAMSPEQMERLSGYKYIEADRAMGWPEPLWDVGLSAGHYSFVMAGDDLHDLARWWTFGRSMTFVLSSSLAPGAIMEALQAGHGYALRLGEPDRFPVLPAVERVDFSADTLRVAFSMPAEIRFIGQGGAVRKSASGAASDFYVFAPGDTYIRVEARFAGGVSGADGVGSAAGVENEGATIYINPLARYPTAEVGPVNASYSTVNWPLTVLHSAAHVLLILGALAGIFLMFWRRTEARGGRKNFGPPRGGASGREPR